MGSCIPKKERRDHPLIGRSKFIALFLAGLIPLSPFPDWVDAAGGNLDPSFGFGGKVVTDFSTDTRGSSRDRLKALAIQSDGKIVAVGDNINTFLLARYDNAGNLDPSFGSGGKVATKLFTRTTLASAMALQSDGKIVVAGTTFGETAGSVFALARYKADGSLDLTFGSNGTVTTDFDNDPVNKNSALSAIAIQPDGKVIAAGSSTTSNRGDDFALARYKTDGSLDSAFGSAGKVTTDLFKRHNAARAVAVQPDGRIVVAGDSDTKADGKAFNGPRNFAVVRYNSDGSLDSSFGSGGKVTTDFLGGADWLTSLGMQRDGKIIVAGYTDITSNGFAMARYNADGGLDSTFGSGGKVVTDFGSGTRSTVAAIGTQASGKIVLAGTTTNDAGTSSFVLARYTADAKLDVDFGSSGTVKITFSGRFERATALAIRPNGKIIVGGETFNSVTSEDFAIACIESSTPRIIRASLEGKSLVVFGEDFDTGAVILVNGQEQKTVNEDLSPSTVLIGKKSGRRISPGQTVTLQVRNADGAISPEFRFLNDG